MPSAKRSPLLPPLAFGEAHALSTTNTKVAAARAARTVNALEFYEAADKREQLHHKVAAVSINGLNLTATASTSLRLGVKSSTDFHLFIPFFGRCSTTVGQRQFEWNANENAAFFTECGPRQGLSETRSLFVAELDKARLIDTACAMLGEDFRQEFSLGVEFTRTLPLQYGPVSFTNVFRQICVHIDALYDRKSALELLGVDDWVYRHAACLLEPGLILGRQRDRDIAGWPSRSPVDAVCDAVRTRGHRPLTLTEMEQISGLSRRSLQYAFRKRFGCSPMAWQQQERLHLARERLIRGAEALTVTQLAYELGFSSPSAFTAYYRRMFGETPTATLSRAQREK
ncbi:AraC family transcriptional regulator [Methylocystis sp. WRRC1]|uniref:AraC family transcriptional regulator n=1 Tax=Methylocystis sp. WRRC1 TaxID=1732014 RepID=UPI001D137D6D|nr:AraC family transcriptional regulator [Methylocystis sp. WRRC1]MCC3243995.1 AraC family transcriptional regulator [Methylocystis sp. WRRC1]